MALIASVIIDTSAIMRIAHPAVATTIVPLVSSGMAATCAALDFEALYSTRSPREYESVRADRMLAYEYLPTDDRDWARALSVQRMLAARSRTRSVGMPDLLIAAVAERDRVTVVHYDEDFDAIAALTGQKTRWVVPRGSL